MSSTAKTFLVALLIMAAGMMLISVLRGFPGEKPGDRPVESPRPTLTAYQSGGQG